MPAPPPNSNLELQVAPADLPILGEGAQTFWLLVPTQVAWVIGRQEKADIRLELDSISRKHAVIRFDNGWRIRDAGSKAGTHINQRSIGDSEQPLKSGDQLRIGPIRLAVSTDQKTVGETQLLDPFGRGSSLVPVDVEGHLSTIQQSSLEGLAQHRLSILIDSSKSFSSATDLASLSQQIVQATARGSRAKRVFLLDVRSDHWIVLGANLPEPDGAPPVGISTSLVSEAKEGRITELQRQGESQDVARSIFDFNIQSALAIPLEVDDQVEAVLYLDARDQEKPLRPDAASFCVGMAKLAGLAIANLRREALRENERKLREELQAARAAQRFFLPKADGTIGCVTYALKAVPGTIVAGDLFDIRQVSEDATLVIMGDVMGKGAPAGIAMAALQTFFRALVPQPEQLAGLVAQANQFFQGIFRGSRFVTLWVGLVQKERSQLTYVDAGHGHWKLIQKKHFLAMEDTAGGPPVGAFKDSCYESETLPLSTDDRILLYSDGLVEQANQAGAMYPKQELERQLQASHSVDQDVQTLHDSLNQFRGDIPLSDDLTLASLQLTR